MPILIEDSLTISLQDLKKWGYFDQKRSGVVEWHQNSQLQSSVAINVGFDEENIDVGGRLILRYTCWNQPVRQSIELVHVRSNLGRGGGIWYFVCPQTGKRCRLLIGSPFGFVSRHLDSIRYRSQVFSHKARDYHNSLAAIRKAERKIAAVQWLCKPNAKRTYGGKFTRPMIRFRKLTGLDP